MRLATMLRAQRSWLGMLVAATLLLAGASTSRAAVISFDDLDAPGPGGPLLTVNNRYESQGVTFNDPSAIDYSKGGSAIPGFAHSPNVGVEPCVGVENCSSPVRATFSTGQEYVKVWVGFSYPLANPLGVRLTAFNAPSGGSVVGTADATLPASASPTPIRAPLTIDLASSVIRRLEVSVTTGGGYTSALAVDDVEFSSVGPPPPCTATAPPTVTLSKPAPGLVVDGDAFPLAGNVATNGAPITNATVVAQSSSQQVATVYPSLISPNGGSFGSASFGGLLGIGMNDVYVTATNCKGTGSSAPRQVARTVAAPGPQPPACIPRADSRDVEVATNVDDLVRVLGPDSNFHGLLIVRGGQKPFDLTGMDPIEIKPGVQIVGERDALGRRPLIRRSDLDTYSMFTIPHPDVCIEGLRLEGPARGSRPQTTKAHAITVHEEPSEYQVVPPPDPVVIADNELAWWTGGAVGVDGIGFTSLCPGPPKREACDGYDGPRMKRSDAGRVRVERNYIHHNATDGSGYGVDISGSAYATISGNVFDYNRHDVTSSGYSFSGYIAHHNYGLEGAYRYGEDGYYAPHFDVHGSWARDPKWYGGIAGEYQRITSNTLRGEQEYCGVVSCKVRAALVLRGRATDGVDFDDNVVVNERDEAFGLKGGEDKRLKPAVPSKFNLSYRRNHFDTDDATKLATGDFDGDGRTDVFLSNGTGWFMSRAGIRPWEFLRPSEQLTTDLGFADVDNDGATDVIRRDSTGALVYYKSGIVLNLVPLTSSPVPIGDLRFGDFDGDHLTDIFYTRNGQWHVWSGATQMWTDAQTSAQPIGKMLFGEFDGVRGTDVAAVVNGAWSYSSGATKPWGRLNSKLRPSFADAVAADFNGNGRTDIAFDDGGTWRYSPDGSSPLRLLRPDQGPSRPLKGLLIGNFDGTGKSSVVRYGPYDPNRFGIWRGVGSDAAFKQLSEQDMR